MFKANVNRRELLGVLGSASKCISARPIIPATGTFRLILDNHGLTVQSSDARMSYCGNVEVVSSSGSGSICVPRQLPDIVGLITDDEIELSAASHGSNLSLHVKSTGTSVKLNCIGDSEFPVLPVATSPVLDMSTSLSEMIATLVQPAALKDNSRPILATVHFRINGGQCDIMATDGYAFSMLRNTSAVMTDANMDIGIPVYSIGTLLSMAPCKVSLSDSGTHAIFSSDSEYTSSLVSDAGQYPDLYKFVRTNVNAGFTASATELNRVILLSTVTHKKDNTSVNVSINNGNVGVSAESEISDAKSNVSASDVSGVADIRFSTAYLVRACKMFAGKDVSIRVDSPTDIVMIDPGISGYMHGIMPMQTK